MKLIRASLMKDLVFKNFIFCFLLVHCIVGLGQTTKILEDVVKSEFANFLENIQNDRRIDKLGYLIEIKPEDKGLKKDNVKFANKVLSNTGKIVYFTNYGGFITHVNYSRLQRLASNGIEYRILDKKRLDDKSEFWYLVWIPSESEYKKLKQFVEPLYKDGNTVIIRIRPDDEEKLQYYGLRYSLIEEELLPLRILDDEYKTIKIKYSKKINDLVKEVSKHELISIIKKLEDFKSRHVKNQGNLDALNWLYEQFRQIQNLEVKQHYFNYGNKTLANVLAFQKGEVSSDEYIIVIGHMDSTVSWGYDIAYAPGADDNGSGAAAVLHIAKIVSKLKMPYSVIYCCVNAEEVGLVGSKALANDIAKNQNMKVKAVLNMDMIADKDDNQIAVIGNSKSNWLIDILKDCAKIYVNLETKCLYNSNVWYSDHSSFWNVGIPAILTIEGYPENSPHYHKPSDIVNNLSPDLLEKTTKANLAALLVLNSEN